METFNCPLCDAPIAYTTARAGQMSACPQCKERVRLPGAPAQSPRRRSPAIRPDVSEVSEALPAARRIGFVCALLGWFWVVCGAMTAGLAIIAFVREPASAIFFSSALTLAGGTFGILTGIVLIAQRAWLVGVTAIWRRIMLALEEK